MDKFYYAKKIKLKKIKDFFFIIILHSFHFIIIILIIFSIMDLTPKLFLKNIFYCNLNLPYANSRKISSQCHFRYYSNNFKSSDIQNLLFFFEKTFFTRREFYSNFYHTYCGNLVFYGHSRDFCYTCLCFFYARGNIRHTEYGNNPHTIDFHTVL